MGVRAEMEERIWVIKVGSTGWKAELVHRASEALSPSPDLEDGAEMSGSNGYHAKVAASKQLMREGKGRL